MKYYGAKTSMYTFLGGEKTKKERTPKKQGHITANASRSRKSRFLSAPARIKPRARCQPSSTP